MVPRPLWQELPDPSGHKLRLLEAGPAFMVTGALASSNPRLRFEGLGATWTQQDADFLRTPGVDLGKYVDASMWTEDPSFVRACGEA